jgi:hypothetical protein
VSGKSQQIRGLEIGPKRFRNYCGLIKIAGSGFPWEKTTKGDVTSVYTNCETALREDTVAKQQGTAGLYPTSDHYSHKTHADREALVRRSWIFGRSTSVDIGASILVTINAADRTSSFTALSLALMRVVGPDTLKAAIGR